MLNTLLSHDLPRSRVLAALLIVTVAGLLATPFLFPGSQSLNVAAKALVFILLVASYDLLLGYTGIVSFAHMLFFGIGASYRYSGTWSVRLDYQHFDGLGDSSTTGETNVDRIAASWVYTFR